MRSTYRLRKIKTYLEEADYTLAVKAYRERLPIVVTGDLIKDDNVFILNNLQDLSLDEAWVQ